VLRTVPPLGVKEVTMRTRSADVERAARAAALSGHLSRSVVAPAVVREALQAMRAAVCRACEAAP
jgi:hypothetical protein